MDGAPEFTFDAEVWIAQAMDAWHFVSLPPEVSDAIADRVDLARPGFGSVRVEVTIGGTTWRTSVFPDSKRGTYVLPVKAGVRRAEGLAAGDTAEVTLALGTPH
jgi:hypothetical protein